MSKQYNTVWQRHQRDVRYGRLMERYYDACARNDGWHEHEVVRLEWRKSSYMLIFKMDDRERHVNIIKQCRKNCGRLTEETRRKIEASIPERIQIHTSCETYYSPGCPYNVGGYRYIHEVNSDDLKKWLTEAGAN